MKKILSCLLAMCVVIGCAGTAAAASLDSDLVGLWQFERSDNLDDLDFESYVEYTADGLYIFQMVVNHDFIRSMSTDQYETNDGQIIFSGDQHVFYTVENDVLTTTAYWPGREPVVQVFHRIAERPPILLSLQRCGDYTYMVGDDGNAVIAKYEGDSEKESTLIIPDNLDGHRVTSVREYAFLLYSFSDVILPDSVTVIDDYAFCNAHIKSIVIPAGVEKIGEDAFTAYDEATSSLKPMPGLTLVVVKGSIAERYCQEHGIPYEYAKTD